MAIDTHDKSGAALIAAAEATFRQANEQWTDMRADVFTVLASMTRPASAYDIADEISARRGKRVAANSVYRILDLFVGRNLARRIESANAYVANAHPGCRHDCIFLICDQCGETTHVDDDALAAEVREIAGSGGFIPARPIIEVRGRCAACAI